MLLFKRHLIDQITKSVKRMMEEEYLCVRIFRQGRGKRDKESLISEKRSVDKIKVIAHIALC